MFLLQWFLTKPKFGPVDHQKYDKRNRKITAFEWALVIVALVALGYCGSGEGGR